jgi:hypothetical protein
MSFTADTQAAARITMRDGYADAEHFVVIPSVDIECFVGVPSLRGHGRDRTIVQPDDTEAQIELSIPQKLT